MDLFHLCPLRRSKMVRSAVMLLWLHLFLVLLLHLSAILEVFGQQKGVEVQTGLGRVRGFRHQLQQSKEEIGVFFGIPYTQPPVGALRFEKPRPLSKWSGILAADKPRSACIYHAWPEGLGQGQKTYSEDCLFVNLFAPLPFQTNHSRPFPEKKPFPVLVIIHGGGFEVGSSHTYHNYEDIGAKVVSQGIVVVSVDYRLGWMGFGSTGTSEMPGNLGLWDQLEALKFIRANIRAFGGDPEQICLYGYSAGSASVSLLGLSPLSRDLFARGIQMSGSPFSAWALNERAVNETMALAGELDCPLDGVGLKKCLTEKPIAEIWSAVDRIGPTRYADVNFAKWSPRVDGDFLPADVSELLERAGPKPTLMGFVELESLCWTLFTGVNNTLAAFAIPWEQLDQFGRQHFEHAVRALVAKPEFFGKELADEVQTLIVTQYLKEDRLAEFSELHGLHFPHYYLQRYTQVLSDLNFIVPILSELELKTARHWPIHLYLNVHYNSREFPGPVKVHQNFHTNDENFLFREAHFPFNFELSEEDQLVEANLVQMLVNFVKVGDPFPTGPVQWLPVSRQRPTQHLRITANPKLEAELEQEVLDRFGFWRHFTQKYGHKWDPVRGAPSSRKH